MLSLNDFRDPPGPLTDVLDEVALIYGSQRRTHFGIGLGKRSSFLIDSGSVISSLVVVLFAVARPVRSSVSI